MNVLLDKEPAPGLRKRLPSDDAGDMRAMPHLVHQRGLGRVRGVGVNLSEVAVPQASPEVEIQSLVRLEMWVIAVDPGVSDGPNDSLARGGEGCADGVAFDRLRGAKHEPLDRLIFPNLVELSRAFSRLDACDGQRTKPVDRRLGEFGEQIVVGVQRIGDGYLIVGREQWRQLRRQRRRPEAPDDPARHRLVRKDRLVLLVELVPIVEELLEDNRPRERRAARKSDVHLDNHRERRRFGGGRLRHLR